MSGDVCLISRHVARSSDWATAATCAPDPVFRTKGASLRLEVVGEGSDITLIPDVCATQAVVDAVTGSGGLMPADNLVIYPIGGRPLSLTLETNPGCQLDLGTTQPH
jgi:hypothetical protein